jgi:hypothetical protein
MEVQIRWQLRECSEDVEALSVYLKERVPVLVGTVEEQLQQQGPEIGGKKFKKIRC